MTKPLKALKYMTRFQCIGPACEDHCCKAWHIKLDRGDVERLQGLGRRSQTVADRLGKAVSINREEGRFHAHFAMRADGKCHFETGGLCEIHRDFGETALPTSCASYPRKVLDQGDHRLLSGQLSCPEVARLCLLAEDGLELASVGDAVLPVRMGEVDPGLAHGDFYHHYDPSVRAFARELLGGSGFFEDRMYLIFYFCKKVAGYFHADCGNDPGPRLTAEMNRFRKPEFQQRILSRRPDPNAAVEAEMLRFLYLLLMSRMKHAQRARFNLLCRQVLGSFTQLQGLDPASVDSQENLLLEIWPEYRQRRQRAMALFGSRIEQYCRHIAGNYWFQEVLVSFNDPFVFCRRLVFFLAAVKFLLFAHPDLPENNSSGEEENLDRLMVAVTQTFMKNISHNHPLLEEIEAFMARQSFTSMVSLNELLRV